MGGLLRRKDSRNGHATARAQLVACENVNMWRFCSAAAFTLLAVLGLSAPLGSTAGSLEMQGGPDLSGRWTRGSVSGSTATGGDGWGPSVEISQVGQNLTVQPGQGKREEYRLEGIETAEVLSVKGCQNVARVTKAVKSRERVTITTWLVTKPACVHGEVDDEPIVDRIGPIEVRQLLGVRRLERITTIFRAGDSMTVEATQSQAGLASTTVTTYRK